MVEDPPKKTGRYCVAHRGLTFGHAYYTAKEGETHYTVGWAQVPEFWPNAWLDGDFNIPSRDSSVKLFGSDYRKPKEKHPVSSQRKWTLWS
jgi:hypothetical protein